jgi:hypothetical protein
VIGHVGAFVGWLIFTVVSGSRETDFFELGSIFGRHRVDPRTVGSRLVPELHTPTRVVKGTKGGRGG